MYTFKFYYSYNLGIKNSYLYHSFIVTFSRFITLLDFLFDPLNESLYRVSANMLVLTLFVTLLICDVKSLQVIENCLNQC